MFLIIQFVRYISMLLLIFLILAQNPKTAGVNTLAQTTKYLSNVRNTESLLTRITWVLILIFLHLQYF
uniref:Probable protein-export membrane protein SecG n=1 Tax=Hildenbrandia rubra TaxID=31481 RepID=A0A1C9CFV4_9FLOR|nr:preprotein translocase subunit G [Hildenbrandia rubra]AOM67261.1 preprotein translocase subunit G [Hildenbrandia rubra]